MYPITHLNNPLTHPTCNLGTGKEDHFTRKDWNDYRGIDCNARGNVQKSERAGSNQQQQLVK
jgi:hypothetical protein